MTLTSIALWAVRLTGMTQVMLGILFWTGRSLPLIPLHMAVGLSFVIALLILVGMAAKFGLPLPLVLLALGYALAVPVFGIIHPRLFPAPAHWIVQVADLLVGLGAMVMGAGLARSVRQRSRAGAPVQAGSALPLAQC